MCLSPHWCVFCNLDGESVNHMFIHCPYSIKVWWLLLREAEAVWVTPKGCFQLLSSNFAALGKGKKTKVLWGCVVQAIFWNLWMESNRRIFEDYKGVGVDELWDRVKLWAALWASVINVFKDLTASSIGRDLRAAVK
ncbi:hypothetical protein L3X38_030656 [Prunus dulcis]|uniref:Reverse transcriptase zinc-binding domain-containing protein n=1 Tax=Prunus dulcis TaxID=3755 RepID=A0AAD4VAN9_PRUDU|nr:hypothetical protein L3X38_030656 [Prunus dulcis]